MCVEQLWLASAWPGFAPAVNPAPVDGGIGWLTVRIQLPQVCSWDQQVAEEARSGVSVINAVPSRDFRRAEFLLGLHLKIKVTRRWMGMTCLLLIPLML